MPLLELGSICRTSITRKIAGRNPKRERETSLTSCRGRRSVVQECLEWPFTKLSLQRRLGVAGYCSWFWFVRNLLEDMPIITVSSRLGLAAPCTKKRHLLRNESSGNLDGASKTASLSLSLSLSLSFSTQTGLSFMGNIPRERAPYTYSIIVWIDGVKQHNS